MREVERNELRVTVGENIIRLSSLEGLTFEIYKATVLPKILEIIVICKDTLAQQYLMECVIQAFPDEYHLQSLEQLLETTASLNSSVDIKSIFINLMEKLSRFANNGGSGEEGSPEGNEAAKLAGDLDIFKLFKKYDRDGSGQLDFAEVPVGCSHAVSVRALLIVQYQLVARLSC